MVEAAAQKLKLSIAKFLIDAGEGSLEYVPCDYMISQHKKLLDFLNGEWEERAEARAKTTSVEEALVQQIELVGSREIYDRVSHDLAMLEITNPFFVREQLLLFKWRVEFFGNFFPIEAAIHQYVH